MKLGLWRAAGAAGAAAAPLGKGKEKSAPISFFYWQLQQSWSVAVGPESNRKGKLRVFWKFCMVKVGCWRVLFLIGPFAAILCDHTHNKKGDYV